MRTLFVCLALLAPSLCAGCVVAQAAAGPVRTLVARFLVDQAIKQLFGQDGKLANPSELTKRLTAFQSEIKKTNPEYATEIGAMKSQVKPKMTWNDYESLANETVNRIDAIEKRLTIAEDQIKNLQERVAKLEANPSSSQAQVDPFGQVVEQPDTDTGDASTRLSRGKRFLKDRMFVEAEQTLKELVTAYPGTSEAAEAASTLAAIQQEADQAKKLREEREAAALLAKLKLCVEEKKFRDASLLLRQIQDRYPSSQPAGEVRKLVEPVAAGLILEQREQAMKIEENAKDLMSKAKSSFGRADYPATDRILNEIFRDYPKTSVIPEAKALASQVQEQILQAAADAAAEKKAEQALQLARSTARDPSKVDVARRRLEELIQKYPKTQSAESARTLLKTLP